MNKRNCICFAYFGDGKFLGWYADSFGSVSKTSPKIYGNTEEQLEIISKNFRSKVAKVKGLTDEDFLSVAAKVVSKFNPAGGALMVETKSDLSGYDDIELRLVECPIYDGPNPDFDRESYTKKVEERTALMQSEGIFDIPGPSKERMAAVDDFNSRHGKLSADNWIYADYTKVKEWAAVEPTEFVGVIKFEG